MAPLGPRSHGSRPGPRWRRPSPPPPLCPRLRSRCPSPPTPRARSRRTPHSACAATRASSLWGTCPSPSPRPAASRRPRRSPRTRPPRRWRFSRRITPLGTSGPPSTAGRCCRSGARRAPHRAAPFGRSPPGARRLEDSQGRLLGPPWHFASSSPQAAARVLTRAVHAPLHTLTHLRPTQTKCRTPSLRPYLQVPAPGEHDVAGRRQRCGCAAR
jgi:hypothetical protein